jgi:hypothetical protein
MVSASQLRITKGGKPASDNFRVARRKLFEQLKSMT